MMQNLGNEKYENDANHRTMMKTHWTTRIKPCLRMQKQMRKQMRKTKYGNDEKHKKMMANMNDAKYKRIMKYIGQTYQAVLENATNT